MLKVVGSSPTPVTKASLMLVIFVYTAALNLDFAVLVGAFGIDVALGIEARYRMVEFDVVGYARPGSATG